MKINWWRLTHLTVVFSPVVMFFGFLTGLNPDKMLQMWVTLGVIVLVIGMVLGWMNLGAFLNRKASQYKE